MKSLEVRSQNGSYPTQDVVERVRIRGAGTVNEHLSMESRGGLRLELDCAIYRMQLSDSPHVRLPACALLDNSSALRAH